VVRLAIPRLRFTVRALGFLRIAIRTAGTVRALRLEILLLFLLASVTVLLPFLLLPVIPLERLPE
jgi:hypothetical protein